MILGTCVQLRIWKPSIEPCTLRAVTRTGACAKLGCVLLGVSVLCGDFSDVVSSKSHWITVTLLP
jgi:hypothetical protein